MACATAPFRGAITFTPSTGLTDLVPKTFDRAGVAANVGVWTAKTMENGRGLGIGPRYPKLGGRVACGLTDLDAWLDEQVR